MVYLILQNHDEGFYADNTTKLTSPVQYISFTMVSVHLGLSLLELYKPWSLQVSGTVEFNRTGRSACAPETAQAVLALLH